jgi:hypothetical protein
MTTSRRRRTARRRRCCLQGGHVQVGSARADSAQGWAGQRGSGRGERGRAQRLGKGKTKERTNKSASRKTQAAAPRGCQVGRRRALWPVALQLRHGRRHATHRQRLRLLRGGGDSVLVRGVCVVRVGSRSRLHRRQRVQQRRGRRVAQQRHAAHQELLAQRQRRRGARECEQQHSSERATHAAHTHRCAPARTAAPAHRHGCLSRGAPTRGGGKWAHAARNAAAGGRANKRRAAAPGLGNISSLGNTMPRKRKFSFACGGSIRPYTAPSILS